MHQGRYDAGFRLFEYRWHPEVLANQVSEYTKKPPKPEIWRGQCLLGKSIVVQMEQGFGDIFMFARFLPFLKVMGAEEVVLLTHGSLLGVLGQFECIDILTNQPECPEVTLCDYWIGDMSLPYYISCADKYAKALFPVTTKKIVGSEGYMDAKPSNIEPKIGVNWGASRNILFHIKSIPDHEMYKLVGDNCYSLSPDHDGFFHPLPNDGWKTDWRVTASHMKAMKGIVTVDTGTAHLAGALGVKTIVLLPKEEYVCWRWKNGKWYDSVIALRQEEYYKVPDLIRRM